MQTIEIDHSTKTGIRPRVRVDENKENKHCNTKSWELTKIKRCEEGGQIPLSRDGMSHDGASGLRFWWYKKIGGFGSLRADGPSNNIPRNPGWRSVGIIRGKGMCQGPHLPLPPLLRVAVIVSFGDGLALIQHTQGL